MIYWQIDPTLQKSWDWMANRCVKPTCVSGQLTADTHVPLTGLQVVDGADVVQTSTGDIVPRGGIGARHHPGGAQRDGVDLEERRKILILDSMQWQMGERGEGMWQSLSTILT